MFSPKVMDSVIIAILLAIALALAFCVSTYTKAGAQGELRGFHNEHHHSKLHHWYQRLMRPDQPKMSCCSSNDCSPTKAEKRGDQWWAMKAGRWIPIPESKMNAEESIDTTAHICWFPHTHADDSVLCFVKPGMAL